MSPYWGQFTWGDGSYWGWPPVGQEEVTPSAEIIVTTATLEGGTFAYSLDRMRRFLRDPDGLVWSDDDLMAYYNEAQFEIAQKTGFLEKVAAFRYPPQFSWSYNQDWEKNLCDGDKFQSLTINQNNGDCITYPWESIFWLDEIVTADDGERFTHPWEAYYCSAGDIVAIPLHDQFSKMKYAAFDLWSISPVDEREVAKNDPYYKTRQGRVVNYYRPDLDGNLMVIYPRPSSIVWDIDDITDIMDDAAGFNADNEEWINDMADTGLPTEIIEADGQLFLAYEYVPHEITELTDELEWPGWMARLIEYATLERAFGAATDGFIPSLRDYWATRKKISLEAVKRLQGLSLKDRDFVMGPQRGRGQRVHPTLGDHYPRTYP